MRGLERVSDPRSQVVITRFECPSLFRLLVVLAMHYRIKREVRRVAPDYLGGATVIDWRRHTLLSVSLWRRLDGIYDMGRSNRHIEASRVPARIGVTTSAGIYGYSGDWRKILFGTPVTDEREPLHTNNRERSTP